MFAEQKFQNPSDRSPSCGVSQSLVAAHSHDYILLLLQMNRKDMRDGVEGPISDRLRRFRRVLNHDVRLVRKALNMQSWMRRLLL